MAHHIGVAHAGVREVRCYRSNGRTSYSGSRASRTSPRTTSSPGGRRTSAGVMGAVMRHAVPGTVETEIWADGF